MHSDDRKTILGMRPCTRIWLLLVLLTLVSFAIGEAQLGGTAVMIFVLALALLKGRLVASHFMGLRRAAFLWRFVMASYLLTVGGMVAAAYLLAA